MNIILSGKSVFSGKIRLVNLLQAKKKIRTFFFFERFRFRTSFAFRTFLYFERFLFRTFFPFRTFLYFERFSNVFCVSNVPLLRTFSISNFFPVSNVPLLRTFFLFRTFSLVYCMLAEMLNASHHWAIVFRMVYCLIYISIKNIFSIKLKF